MSQDLPTLGDIKMSNTANLIPHLEALNSNAYGWSLRWLGAKLSFAESI